MAILSRYMTDDHEACDRLFAEAENAAAAADWATAAKQFDAFRAATLRHFLCEEDVLFPAFEERTGMTAGPTMVMRDEHTQVRSVLDAMANAVASHDMESYLGYSETLLMLLRQHNLKEEQMLYPMIDRAMPDAVDALVARMRELTA